MPSGVHDVAIAAAPRVSDTASRRGPASVPSSRPAPSPTRRRPARRNGSCSVATLACSTCSSSATSRRSTRSSRRTPPRRTGSGDPTTCGAQEVMRAMRALFDGQLDEGELLARDAFEVGTRLQLSGALQAFVVQTFFLAWQRRALEPLIDLARQWADAQDNVTTWRASLALACASGPRRRGTRPTADIGRRRFRAHRAGPLWLATLAVAAEAAWTIGEQACAEPLRDRAHRRTSTTTRPSAPRSRWVP